MAESVGGLIVSMGMDVSKFAAGAEQAKVQARITGAAVAEGFAQGAKQYASGKGYGAGAIDAEFSKDGSYEARMARRRYNFDRQSPHAPGDAGAAMYMAATNPDMLGIGGERGSGRWGGAVGRGIAQLGFAGQDFASVLEGGGKNALSRALMSTMNNVQMLGAAFGPWGLALTAIGGTLGALVIPKLFNVEEAFSSLGSASERAVMNLEKFQERITTMLTFGAKVGELDSPDKADALRKDVALEKDIAAARAKKSTEALALADKQLAEDEKARDALFPKGMGKDSGTGARGIVNWVAKHLFNPGAALDAMPMNAKLDEDRKAREKLAEINRKDLEAADLANKKGEAIGKAEDKGDIETAERHRRNEKEAEEGERRARQISKNARTPLQVAEDSLNEIGTMFREGLFGQDPTKALAAADKTISDFESATKVRGRQFASTNEAAVGGTSAGFRALVDSLNQSRNDPLTETQKQALETLRQIRDTLISNKPSPEPESAGID